MSTSGRSAPPRYHHGDLRRALLTAAEALFAEGGAEALSLREVARSVGVSHNAPYRHFPDREALLAALATEGFRRLEAALTAAIADAGANDRLVACGQAYLDFAGANRALYLLMFGPSPRRDAHPDLDAAAAAAFGVLRGAVDDLGPAVRAPRHGAVGAWALVHGLAHLAADGRLPADGGAALAADVLATYAAGLLSRPAGPPGVGAGEGAAEG